MHSRRTLALSELTGRRISNLSRTLNTVSSYGVVELKRSAGLRQVRPIVKAEEFKILAAAQFAHSDDFRWAANGPRDNALTIRPHESSMHHHISIFAWIKDLELEG